MPHRTSPKLIFLALCASCISLWAQTTTLRGVVTDQSGAVVPKAAVTLKGPAGLEKTMATAGNGSYAFTDLPAGDYTVEAKAPQLALPQPQTVSLRGGIETLNLQLQVATQAEQVTVQDNLGPALSTDAASNAGATVLRGDDLQALADDPEDLAADLQALAGPSAGPNSGQLFVDGFTSGQLPPKESIREIRINSNPFSAEYDTLGYGRIEVFTKPGTDKFRGTLFHNFSDDFWNSRNPYAAQKAPFLLREYGGNVSGPLGKRASFTLDIERAAIDNGAIINGSIVDSQTLAIIDPYTQVFRVPQRRVIVTPRADYQLNAQNTLTVRYSFMRANIADADIGSFNLVSEGYGIGIRSQTLQATETMVIGSSAVNETRFQYFRVANVMTPNTAGAAIQVLGSFNGGAAPIGNSSDTQNNYELHNYTSLVRSNHTWRFGVRLRGATDHNVSRQNFAGTFTFGGGLAPALDAGSQPVFDAGGQALEVDISSIERYQRTLQFQRMGLPADQIRALGGGASQFTISTGTPSVYAGQFDFGGFAADDWRVSPNLTLSLGLRYETQTNIHDWSDFAPRVGLAWAPGGKTNSRPKTVIRAGFGVFYDRFSLANTITSLLYNGIVQQQYILTNPNFFPNVPSVAQLGTSASASSIWEISSRLRAPYLMQSAVAVERQLPANTTISVTYANAHGLHLLRSSDINAPLPGTFDPQSPSSGVFPFARPGPVFLMQSSGLYNQNQVIANVNSKVRGGVSLFGSYVFTKAMSNTDGLNTFPASPYSMAGEYGPALTDIRHRVSFGGTLSAPWAFSFSPLLTLYSGPPFDITVGHDLYGDTLFNGRPGIATDPAKPGVIQTSYGLLDPNPTPDERMLPRNFGRGPGIILFNFRVAKTFAFGHRKEGNRADGGGGEFFRRVPTGPFATGGGGQGGSAANRRYTLALSMSVRNIINHDNPGPIIGNIASPSFGQANQPYGVGTLGGTGFSESANNRRLEMQARFNF
jgi:carboxypeptidase family protein